MQLPYHLPPRGTAAASFRCEKEGQDLSYDLYRLANARPLTDSTPESREFGPTLRDILFIFINSARFSESLVE